ncbi:MAG: pyrroline-5-carboxylate reductase [Bacteriovoracaceae bacterium]|nr:pyrroline-5-carboxylate reductase [Bacteriovoracaceae bacterium]
MKILTLGAGNMAQALLSSMKEGISSIHTFTPTGVRAKKLADLTEGIALKDLSETPRDIDVLLLAFKPQHFTEAVSNFLKASNWNEWEKKPLVVSMLAGTPLNVLKDAFQYDLVVRIMPNTPSKVGKGITLILPSPEVSKNQVKNLEDLFELAGPVYSCRSEDQMDAMTAVTGSGPAYIFEFTRILAEFLREQGVEPEKAHDLSVSLMVGSSKLMEESNISLEELRNNVTSKNGVTFAALESFKESDFSGIIKKALELNVKRSLELRDLANN